MKLVLLTILFSTLTVVFYASAAVVSAKQENSVKVLKKFRGNRNNAFENNFDMESSNSFKTRRQPQCPPGCCPGMPEEPCSLKWSWTVLSKMKRKSCPPGCCDC